MDKICKARSIENQTRLIEPRVDLFFCRNSNSAQARLTCRVFYFTPNIKRKTVATFQKSFGELCVESFVRSRSVYLRKHTQGYQDQDSCQELDDLFSCCIKNFKEDLKPLSGVSKSQVGELVAAVDQRKKQSVDSKLSCGRGSKFSTQGSNRMLVV